jgi:cell division protein ZapA
MDRRTVELRIAGQSYKVVSTASEQDLHRLAETVSAKVTEMTPRGRATSPQSMLLAAIALAHELEAERDRRESLERRTRDLLRRVLVRIDDALDLEDEPDDHDDEADADAEEGASAEGDSIS